MRRYIAILLCMAVAVGAVACQPTPEQAVVVKKDTERMIEQAMTSDESTAEKAMKDAVQAPDNFVFNIQAIAYPFLLMCSSTCLKCRRYLFFRQNQGISRLNRH